MFFQPDLHLFDQIVFMWLGQAHQRIGQLAVAAVIDDKRLGCLNSGFKTVAALNHVQPQIKPGQATTSAINVVAAGNQLIGFQINPGVALLEQLLEPPVGGRNTAIKNTRLCQQKVAGAVTGNGAATGVCTA